MSKHRKEIQNIVQLQPVGTIGTQERLPVQIGLLSIQRFDNLLGRIRKGELSYNESSTGNKIRIILIFYRGEKDAECTIFHMLKVRPSKYLKHLEYGPLISLSPGNSCLIGLK